MITLKSVAPSASRPALQPLRVVALVGLVIGLSFVADLVVLSLLRPSLDFLRDLLYFGYWPVLKANALPALVLIFISLVAGAFAVGRLYSRGRSSLIFSGLLIASVLVADLLIMAFVRPGLLDPLTELFTFHHVSDWGFVVGLLGVIPLTVAVVVFRLRSWRWIGGSYAALGVILVYLATDETRHSPPLAFEQISPVFPGDGAAYNVFMRYGKNHPLGKNFRQPDRIFKGSGKWVGANKPAAEWSAWLETHRAEVEADWDELAPVRAWIDELNTYDRIADLMPAEVTAEIIAFGPLRSYTNHASDIAGLQAMAGHGDEAIATLLPLLQVSRKLEPSARSLVRAMIARAMQDTGVSAARFVLNRTTVSPAMRARLAASLTLGVGGEAGARRLLMIESTFFSAATVGRPLGYFLPMERRQDFLSRGLNVAGPFLYNRNRTANLHRELSDSLLDFAAHRDMEGLKKAQLVFCAEHDAPKFKNFLGDFIVGATVPAYQKVIEAYWRIEDSRTSLLAQLAQPSSPSAQRVAVLAP